MVMKQIMMKTNLKIIALDNLRMGIIHAMTNFTKNYKSNKNTN